MAAKVENLPSTPDISHDIDEHYGLTVRIKVGKGGKGKIFEIHRGVLQFYSGYFRAAIKNIDDGNFAESVNGVVALPEDDLQIFAMFKRWLYAPGRCMLPRNPFSTHEHNYFDYDTLVKLWCFAEVRIIPMLQNRAVDLIIAKMASNSKMSTSTIRYVFTEAGADSALRKLVVKYHAHSQCLEMGNDLKKKDIASETWFGEFCKDVTIERLTGQPVPSGSHERLMWSRCPYHIHEKGAVCVSKGWNIL